MKLNPTENELVGRWNMVGGRLTEDETSRRIGVLVREHLNLVATSIDGWERLFQDSGDGRFWELIYPSSEMHSGGPPTLRVIQGDIAREKYRLP